MVGSYVDIFNHTIPAGVLKDKTTAAAAADEAACFGAAGEYRPGVGRSVQNLAPATDRPRLKADPSSGFDWLTYGYNYIKNTAHSDSSAQRLFGTAAQRLFGTAARKRIPAVFLLFQRLFVILS